MAPELRGSRLEFTMTGQHPIFQSILEVASGRGPIDPLPMDGIDMTMLINFKNEYGISLAFGLEQLLDLRYKSRESLLTSIWTPKSISAATHHDYIVQRFEHGQ